MTARIDAALDAAAALLRSADGLLIGAGAGMGVDSGLPDFRGGDGFWRAYPPLAAAGIRFVEIANPHAFDTDPALAWGFYGHRLALYRATAPHAGFAILRALGDRLAHGTFIFTSNVDGQFGSAGFAGDRIVECHGSIHHLQCTRPCTAAIWSADAVVPVVDTASCRMDPPLPRCPHCGALACTLSCRRGARPVDGRHAPGASSHGKTGRQRKEGGAHHARTHTPRRDSLEHPHLGRSLGHQRLCCGPHLARPWSETTSGQVVQAVQ